jgi:hypothetical protein
MPLRTEVIWAGAAASATVHAAAAKGLRIAGEHVLQESREIVPIDEGPLIRSGAVDVDPQKLICAVSYDTPYAVIQHEIPMRHAPGKTHKYLEGPLNANASTIRDLVAATIRRALR